MGTQQILLIVLSVIIVGIAIVVGIMMFNNQAYNANKQAVASENTTYGSLIVQWWKTPKSQGGAGQDPTMVATANMSTIASYIGFDPTDLNLVNLDTGEFTLSNPVAGPPSSLTITGLGKDIKAGKQPQVITIVSLPDGTMTATASDEDVVSGT